MSWNRVGNGFLPGSFGRNREQYLIGVVEATDGDVLLFQRSLRHHADPLAVQTQEPKRSVVPLGTELESLKFAINFAS